MSGRRTRSTQGLALAVAGIGMSAALAFVPTLAAAWVRSGEPASTASAAMHLKLLKADPAIDSTTATAPTALRLWFSEAVVLKATSVKVIDASGAQVKLAPLSSGKNAKEPIVAKVLSKLAPGHYTVSWRAMGDDSHVVTGHYGFTIGGKAAVAATPAAPAKPAPAKPAAKPSAKPAAGH